MPTSFLKQWAGPSGKLFEYARKYIKLVSKPVGLRCTGFEPLFLSQFAVGDGAFLEQSFVGLCGQDGARSVTNALGR
ncbi:DUF4238 domain-containing protein [Nitrobacter sp. TKz-YC01]